MTKIGKPEASNEIPKYSGWFMLKNILHNK